MMSDAGVEHWKDKYACLLHALGNPTIEALDAALVTTATFRDIPGSQLTVNREKMRMRLEAFLKHTLKEIGDG